MRGFERKTGIVFRPAILRADQLQRGLAAALCRLGGLIERLVEQDSHRFCLVFAGFFLDLDLGVGMHPRAQRRDHLAIHTHPTVLDPLIGFAPRTLTHLGDAFR